MDGVEQKYLYDTVGDNIRKFRNISGLNQQDLADTLALSRASIVNIEKGRQHVSLHLLISMTRIFNVKLEDFLPKDFSKSKEEIKTLKTKISKELNSLKKSSGEQFDNDKIMDFILKK